MSRTPRLVPSLLAAGLLSSGTAAAYPIVDKPLEGSSFERVHVDLGGYVQPRFRWFQGDEDAGIVEQIGFSVQRVRLELETGFKAPAHRPWGFSVDTKLAIELMPDPVLQDAYVNFGLGTYLQLRLGQFKAPIHRAILVSDANNLFPDRNQITTFVPEREIGMMLHGWVGERLVEYQVAMFNGEGKNRLANINTKFLYAARIVFSPLGSPGSSFEILKDWRPEGETRFRPTFSFGYSFHTNTTGTEGQQVFNIGHNVEGFFHYRWLTLMSEFFYKDVDWENPELEDFRQIGWYVQAGLFLPKVPWAEDHLALMGRVEQGDSFKPDSPIPPAGANDPAQASRRYSVGLGVYAGEPLFDVVQDLRFVVSYTIREELEGAEGDNNELNLQVNMSF